MADRIWDFVLDGQTHQAAASWNRAEYQAVMDCDEKRSECNVNSNSVHGVKFALTQVAHWKVDLESLPCSMSNACDLAPKSIKAQSLVMLICSS